MTVARGFGLNGKSLYSNICKPCEVDFNFVVDSSNGNGLGIRSLKSNGYVRNVFMHTSVAPGSNNGYTNPNPAVGFALIQFNNNFNYYLGGFSGFVTGTTGSIKIDNSALTAGQPYIITTLGNSTTAQWQGVGLPLGITPAVGVSFVATSVGAGANTSTSRVSTPVPRNIVSVQIVGDPNLSVANSNLSQYGGAWLLVEFLAATDASTTTLIATAPADGSVIGMKALFDGSSVTIDGL